MNIQQIKTQIGNEQNFSLLTLEMVRQFETVPDPADATKTVEQKAPWLSHWDNTKRVRVTMHEDIFTKLKADSNMNGLALKREDVPAKAGGNGTEPRAAYVRYVVITPANIEGSF